MPIISDKIENEVEDNVIDSEEIKQLQQDLQKPIHYLNSANNSDIFIGQSRATVPSQLPYEQRETIENTMPGFE
ncbi:hypothetical protein G6F43_002622 [Rhizopus delemar]|nr:hypothetical protein G6F43_002622 [Rhizopus delemar]